MQSDKSSSNSSFTPSPSCRCFPLRSCSNLYQSDSKHIPASSQGDFPAWLCFPQNPALEVLCLQLSSDALIKEIGGKVQLIRLVWAAEGHEVLGLFKSWELMGLGGNWLSFDYFMVFILLLPGAVHSPEEGPRISMNPEISLPGHPQLHKSTGVSVVVRNDAEDSRLALNPPQSGRIFQNMPQILYFQLIFLLHFCLGQLSLLPEAQGHGELCVCPANLRDLFWILKSLLNYPQPS